VWQTSWLQLRSSAFSIFIIEIEIFGFSFHFVNFVEVSFWLFGQDTFSPISDMA